MDDDRAAVLVIEAVLGTRLQRQLVGRDVCTEGTFRIDLDIAKVASVAVLVFEVTVHGIGRVEMPARGLERRVARRIADTGFVDVKAMRTFLQATAGTLGRALHNDIQAGIGLGKCRARNHITIDIGQVDGDRLGPGSLWARLRCAVLGNGSSASQRERRGQQTSGNSGTDTHEVSPVLAMSNSRVPGGTVRNVAISMPVAQ